MRLLFALAFVLIAKGSFSQANDFPFGRITYNDLEMKVYSYDTTASAIMLNEFGEAYFDEQMDFNLVFTYHATIKILKQSGIEKANFEIPLYHSGSRREDLISIKASSYSLINNVITETKLDPGSVFTENSSKYWDRKKFAVPSVTVGSVIEVQYVLVSPFVFNFRNWNFQADIPKAKSEFWATIPGNYIYNTTLKGYLDLSKNESELIRKCFYNGRADCARYKYAMEHVPAFYEEDYMTAKSNFLAAINYELSEIRHFDGRVEKFTKEWKDAELELKTNEKFGLQLKRGQDIVDSHVEMAAANEKDNLARAKKVYDFIKYWYKWDEVYGMFSEYGIKKAFDNKIGNVGDINLTLIAALKHAGFNVDPVILSTRQNGLPIELHPVLSDFNYVIGRMELDGQVYLLDATDDFLPFGTIPIRCFNGKGRVIGEGGSYWMELKPTEKDKTFTAVNLIIDKDGNLKGKIKKTHYGYAAVSKRKEILGYPGEGEYAASMNSQSAGFHIAKVELQNKDDFARELVEVFEIDLEESVQPGQPFILNPFLMDRIDENPFKSRERLYPVDYGVPLDYSLFFTLEFPEEYTISELPEKTALALPNAGGRYLFAVQQIGTKLTMNSMLNINRPVYSSQEYYSLRELYNRVVQVQNSAIVLQTK